MLNNRSRSDRFIKEGLGYVLIAIGFILYVVYVKKAFHDVPWMDQVNLFATKIPDFYKGHVPPSSAVYEQQYQLFPSIIIANYLNARWFSLDNRYFVTALMLVVLITILLFYRKFNYLFDAKQKWLYAAILVVFLFNPIRWEDILASDFGVFLIAYSLLNVSLVYYSHRYYFGEENDQKKARAFMAIFIILSIINSIDNGGYFLPYLCSSLLLAGINFFAFKNVIIKKRWWQITGLTSFFIAFTVFIDNYLRDRIFGADGGSGYSSSFVNLLLHSPGFVVKFYLNSNTGNFFTFELYDHYESLRPLVPFLGALALLLYGVCIYQYIRYKQKHQLFFILLIFVTLSYYFFILVARSVLSNGNVYYGASSRYGATTLFGMVGVCSAILLFKNNLLKYLSLAGAAVLVVVAVISSYSQYKVAPYRKVAMHNMEVALKKDTNLYLLQAHSVEKAHAARAFMIAHDLGVFKPREKITTYTIDQGNINAFDHDGLYDIERSDNDSWQWTNGESQIILPNLLPTTNKLDLTVSCYMPNGDTARVILNDDLSPVAINKTDNGFKYTFTLSRPTVLYRIRLFAKSMVPHEKDPGNPDLRRLGFMFKGIKFESL